MQRRNTTLGDRIIQQLAQFAVDELGLGDDVEKILKLQYVDGSRPTGDTLVALWDLIQANDSEPSADIADYINDSVLGQAARETLVEVGLR